MALAGCSGGGAGASGSSGPGSGSTGGSTQGASSGSGAAGSSSGSGSIAGTASSGAGGSSGAATSSSGGAASGGNPNFAGSGCPLFAPDYAYNVDVSQDAPDPNSATYISSLTSLAPKIAAEAGAEIYNLVPASQAQVSFNTTNTILFLSDGGVLYSTTPPTAPIPSNVVYENENCCSGADHHLMVLQEGSCREYEAYSTNTTVAQQWGILLDYDLDLSGQIPTSFDTGSTTQAGTPLIIGTIWPVEVNAGVIPHALDIVMADNAIMPCAFVPPASTVRYSGAPAGQGIPYGVKLRLKASYDTSGYTGTQALVVVKALQTYGMIPTDGSGETRSVFRLGLNPDGGGLDQTDMNQLNQLTWDDFDVMPVGTILTEKGCTP
jgi:hypothetical protein